MDMALNLISLGEESCRKTLKHFFSHYVCVGELSFRREKCRKCYLHTQSVSKPFIQGSSILGFSVLVTKVVPQLNYRIFRGKKCGFSYKGGGLQRALR